MQSDSNCGPKSLEIRLEDYTVFDTLCGTDLPMNLIVPSNLVHFRFRTDGSMPRAAFKLDFAKSEKLYTAYS